ncbi:MAG: hypothetical protein E7177_02195 [Erysipelotrichaceae bacterium]|nr:hypothetical protein [Erysipelotrichaceae bacterium]
MKIGLVDSGIGVVPFIKEIIKQNKNNDYYLFIDNEYFPYGNKSEKELLDRLLFIFNYFERYSIEQLLICCNTLSYIYLKYLPKSIFKVTTILQINLTKNSPLLTTEYLSKNINSISGEELASFIEENNIINIIKLIKNIEAKELVLSCTHYPLIKSLFSYYKIKAYSFENELIESLKSEKNNAIFYLQKKDLNVIKKYFSNLCISLLDD